MATTPSFYLSWGMLSIPIKSYPAARSERVDLATLHKDCFDQGHDARVKLTPLCLICNKEITKDNQIKGYEVKGAEKAYVTIAPEEIESLAAEKSKTMEVVGFVKAGEIDPVYFNRADHLGPADPAASRAFALLRAAMLKAGVHAVVKYVGYGHDKIGLIRATAESLMLHELFFQSEVRAFEKQNKVPFSNTVGEQELTLAVKLITTGQVPARLEGFTDGYKDRLNTVIQARLEGKELPKLEERPAAPKLGDLLDALKQMEQAQIH